MTEPHLVVSTQDAGSLQPGIHLVRASPGIEEVVKTWEINNMDQDVHSAFDLAAFKKNGGILLNAFSRYGIHVTDISDPENIRILDPLHFDDSENVKHEKRGRFAVIKEYGDCFAATYFAPSANPMRDENYRPSKGHLYEITPSEIKPLVLGATTGPIAVANYKLLYVNGKLVHLKNPFDSKRRDPLFETKDSPTSEGGVDQFIALATGTLSGKWYACLSDNTGTWYLLNEKGILGRSPDRNSTHKEHLELSVRSAAESIETARLDGKQYILMGLDFGEMIVFELNSTPNTEGTKKQQGTKYSIKDVLSRDHVRRVALFRVSHPNHLDFTKDNRVKNLLTWGNENEEDADDKHFAFSFQNTVYSGRIPYLLDLAESAKKPDGLTVCQLPQGSPYLAKNVFKADVLAMDVVPYT